MIALYNLESAHRRHAVVLNLVYICLYINIRKEKYTFKKNFILNYVKASPGRP